MYVVTENSKHKGKLFYTLNAKLFSELYLQTLVLCTDSKNE